MGQVCKKISVFYLSQNKCFAVLRSVTSKLCLNQEVSVKANHHNKFNTLRTRTLTLYREGSTREVNLSTVTVELNLK